MTNIFDAIKNNNLEQLKKAIDEGADINVARDDGATPLYFAAYKGHSEVVQHLLEKEGIEVNKADKYGDTPLYIAAQNGHLEVVKHLLAQGGIEVDKADNDYGFTPLYVAAQGGHLEIVQHLLAQGGIEVNKAKNGGFTPLYAAARNGHLEVVQHLLAQEGIEVDKARDNGLTPLHVAAQKNHVNIGAILLIHGANSDGAQNISNFSEFYKKAINNIAQGILEYDEYRVNKLAFAMGDHPRLGEKSHVRKIDNNIIKTILDLAGPPKIELNKMQQQHSDEVQQRISELQQGKVAPSSNVAAKGVAPISSAPRQL